VLRFTPRAWASPLADEGWSRRQSSAFSPRANGNRSLGASVMARTAWLRLAATVSTNYVNASGRYGFLYELGSLLQENKGSLLRKTLQSCRPRNSLPWLLNNPLPTISCQVVSLLRGGPRPQETSPT